MLDVQQTVSVIDSQTPTFEQCLNNLKEVLKLKLAEDDAFISKKKQKKAIKICINKIETLAPEQSILKNKFKTDISQTVDKAIDVLKARIENIPEDERGSEILCGDYAVINQLLSPKLTFKRLPERLAELCKIQDFSGISLSNP